MRTFAVINQKGGCGKTSTAINLAAAFAAAGRRTLLVDVDPQGHCALGLSVPEAQLEQSIADGLLTPPGGGIDAHRLVWQISGRLDLLPSTTNLAAVEARLADAPDRDRRLANVLGHLAERYELAVIDCPPSIGLLTFNALRAAGEVLIPVETGYFAYAGAIKQAATLQVLADRLNRRVAFHVLPSMHDTRTQLARRIAGQLHERFGSRVLPTPIHHSVKLREAASFGQPIVEYDPASRAAQDFERLATHLLHAGPPTEAERLDTAPAEQAGLAEAAESLSEPAAPPADGPAHADGAEPAHENGTPPNNRAAELARRARELTRRTRQLQQRLADDPDMVRAESESGRRRQPPRDPQAKRSLAQKLSKLYGARVTSQGTLFVQPDGEAVGPIYVAGDFNGWSAERTPLQRNEQLGVWEACLSLPPGRYAYRLVADGRWYADPHNDRAEPGPNGQLNSIVEVG